MSKKLLPLLLILITAVVLFLASGRLVIYLFSNAYGLDVSYKNMKILSFNELSFTDLKVIDRRTGLGIFSRESLINPVLEKRIAIDFKFKAVSFIKNETASEGNFDSLAAIVSMPFASRWTYKEISGKVTPSKEGMHIEKLTATSDDMRLKLSGDIFRDNTIKADIVIYFSESLAKNMPKELSGVILNAESDSWKSLSVKLAGNYKEPSIQIYSKLFRLNINELKTS